MNEWKCQQTIWVKNSAGDNLKNLFLFFPENRLWHFIQSVSWGDTLHEMWKSIFWGKKKKKYVIDLSSAKILPSMLSVWTHQVVKWITHLISCGWFSQKIASCSIKIELQYFLIGFKWKFGWFDWLNLSIYFTSYKMSLDHTKPHKMVFFWHIFTHKFVFVQLHFAHKHLGKIWKIFSKCHLLKILCNMLSGLLETNNFSTLQLVLGERHYFVKKKKKNKKKQKQQQQRMLLQQKTWKRNQKTK